MPPARTTRTRVTLDADTLLALDGTAASAASVNFEQMVDGPYALTVNATTTTFGGVVGGGAPLASLTTAASGTTAIDGGAVTTSGLKTIETR